MTMFFIQNIALFTISVLLHSQASVVDAASLWDYTTDISPTAGLTTTKPGVTGPSSDNLTGRKCIFEQSSICGYTQDKTDNFDWLYNRGPTPSAFQTGPTFDHTYDTSQGHYLYIETSGPRIQGDKARIISPSYIDTTAMCMKFWYNMHGRDVGTLNVYAKNGDLGLPIFTMSGNQGKKWIVGQATVPQGTASQGYQVVFEGIRGTSYYGDIAIDDVSFTAGGCSNPAFTRSTTQNYWTSPGYNTPIRLVDGNHTGHGRVEVYYNGRWGTVCDDGFDGRDADVICRMLGFNESLSFDSNPSLSGSGPIFVDELLCLGYETDIIDCISSTWGTSDCSHSEDIEVECDVGIDIRLLNGYDRYSGRVEVNVNGTWGVICDDDFDNDDARVICRMLNMYDSYHGVHAYSNSRFGYGNNLFIIDDLQCHGSESDISECSSRQWFSHNCGQSEVAGVDCRASWRRGTTSHYWSTRAKTSYPTTSTTETRTTYPYYWTTETWTRPTTKPYYSTTTPYYSTTTPYYSTTPNWRHTPRGTTTWKYWTTRAWPRPTTKPYYSTTTPYYSTTTPYYSTTPNWRHTPRGTTAWKYWTTRAFTRKTTPYYWTSTTWTRPTTKPYYSTTTPYYSTTTPYYSTTPNWRHTPRGTTVWKYWTTRAFTRGTTQYYWTSTRPSVSSVITVNCDESGWDINVDMNQLRRLYPSAVTSDIYLGENSCTGSSSYYGSVQFRQGLRQCLTSEIVRDGDLVYTNELVYAVHDPNHPFIIKNYLWTVPIECDVERNASSEGHLHHSGHSVTSSPSVVGHSKYHVNMTFYRDPNFMYEISGYPLQVKVGSQVYVKMFSPVADWTVKMRVHSCYTKPTAYAPDHLKYYIIKNGCEVDSNTHLLSQAAHETRFVFQDFEYTSSHEGIHLVCDAKFCDAKDYSSQCSQTCNPIVRRNVAVNETESAP